MVFLLAFLRYPFVASLRTFGEWLSRGLLSARVFDHFVEWYIFNNLIHFVRNINQMNSIGVLYCE